MLTDQQQHPITPPPELVDRLRREAPPGISDPGRERHLAIAAYRAGADAELWARCELLDINGCPSKWIDMLRAVRRPKPPSLAEQAIAELDIAVIRGDCITTSDAIPSLRAALERLQELEKGNE